MKYPNDSVKYGAEDKEEEIQIGLPTDVRHVAHIGWDGPSLESPSWVLVFLISIRINCNL